jgi:cytochrome c-type biogenesis protein CcmH/NrfG
MWFKRFFIGTKRTPADPRLHGPYWMRAHKDWRFLAVVFLMLVAMGIYVSTANLAWRPRFRWPKAAISQDLRP